MDNFNAVNSIPDQFHLNKGFYTCTGRKLDWILYCINVRICTCTSSNVTDRKFKLQFKSLDLVNAFVANGLYESNLHKVESSNWANCLGYSVYRVYQKWIKSNQSSRDTVQINVYIQCHVGFNNNSSTHPIEWNQSQLDSFTCSTIAAPHPEYALHVFLSAQWYGRYPGSQIFPLRSESLFNNGSLKWLVFEAGNRSEYDDSISPILINFFHNMIIWCIFMSFCIF